MRNDFSFACRSSFIGAGDMVDLSQKFDTIFNGSNYMSAYPNVRSLTSRSLSKEPLFGELQQQIADVFSSLIQAYDLQFSKLWLVSSKSTDTDATVLPYIPHFDKRRFLKAMVYLHDVSVDHGPIHLGKAKDPMAIERRREQLPSDYKERGLNTIASDDVDGCLTPIVGHRGDIVFFDTNAPHAAGIVTEGYQRKVLRFDFERPTFNPRPSLLTRLLHHSFNKNSR